MGSLRPEWTPDAEARQLTVDVQTVDEVVRTHGINRIDLLKIDVEGLELDVLTGAGGAFALIDRVVLEYHSVDLGRGVAELLACRGLSIALDEKQSWSSAIGMLYTQRRFDSVLARSAVGATLALKVAAFSFDAAPMREKLIKIGAWALRDFPDGQGCGAATDVHPIADRPTEGTVWPA